MDTKSLIALLTCSFVLLVFFIFGDGSLNKLKSIKESVLAQTDINQQLSSRVKDLQSQVIKLKTDDRFLEKTVRNELGLVKDSEIVFIFDE